MECNGIIVLAQAQLVTFNFESETLWECFSMKGSYIFQEDNACPFYFEYILQLIIHTFL